MCSKQLPMMLEVVAIKMLDPSSVMSVVRDASMVCRPSTCKQTLRLHTQLRGISWSVGSWEESQYIPAINNFHIFQQTHNVLNIFEDCYLFRFQSISTILCQYNQIEKKNNSGIPTGILTHSQSRKTASCDARCSDSALSRLRPTRWYPLIEFSIWLVHCIVAEE